MALGGGWTLEDFRVAEHVDSEAAEHALNIGKRHVGLCLGLHTLSVGLVAFCIDRVGSSIVATPISRRGDR